MRETATSLYTHVVWATWDRLPLIVHEQKDLIYNCIRAECTNLKVKMVAIGGIEDHVHLLVDIHPTVSVANMTKQIKGSSSHLANSKMPSGRFFKWQGAYRAFSVSVEDVPKIIQYIQNQEQHHRNQTCQEQLEIS